MTCLDIYKLALSLIGEETSGEYSEDYEKRAPYLLAAFFFLCKKVDELYRNLTNGGEQPAHQGFCAPLDSEFPFCEIFVPAAGYYLASMLIFDSDAERADMLFEKHRESMDTALRLIAAEREKIKNVYPV